GVQERVEDRQAEVVLAFCRLRVASGEALRRVLHIDRLGNRLAEVAHLPVHVLHGGVRLDNDILDALQQRLDALTVLGQGVPKGGEALFLALTEALELSKREPLEQLAVTLDLAAEEVAYRDPEQRPD